MQAPSPLLRRPFSPASVGAVCKDSHTAPTLPARPCRRAAGYTAVMLVPPLRRGMHRTPFFSPVLPDASLSGYRSGQENERPPALRTRSSPRDHLPPVLRTTLSRFLMPRLNGAPPLPLMKRPEVICEAEETPLPQKTDAPCTASARRRGMPQKQKSPALFRQKEGRGLSYRRTRGTGRNQAFTTIMRGETLSPGTGRCSPASIPKSSRAGREASRRCISMSTANS